MENLETGKDKIQKICDILKNETLIPAKEEAQQIILDAEEQARAILQKAQKESEQLLNQAKNKIEQERQLFQNSLRTAGKQLTESLRQDIENNLFNKSLPQLLQKEMSDPKVIAKLINVLIEAIQKEGTSADFSAWIPKALSTEEVNKLLLQEVRSALKEGQPLSGNFLGGAKIQLHDEKVTLDLSEESLKELLGRYLRKDFRELLF